MAGQYRVRVRGPLEELSEGFRGELVGRGYSWASVEAQLGLMKHLSGWLELQGLSAGDLAPEAAAQFIAERRRTHSYLRSPRALVPLLGFLREQGAAPVPPVVAAVAPADVVAARFAQYLSQQRGLAAETVRSYLSQVRPFLAEHVDEDGCCGSLTAQRVAAFVTGRAVGQRPRSVQVGANALRALLRWMWREQMGPGLLTDAVGLIAAPTLTSIPKALSADQVFDMLVALPADGPVRLRNEAMLTLMWRLGLRAGEVAALRLDDIDWRLGVVTVQGKGGGCEPLPLPVDVGKLLAAYARRGRPVGNSHRQVFLGVDAPHRPLSAAAVSSVAARAFARAGITGPGAAHRLRHTAACGVLAGGGGLMEAGQLLRHASPAATAIYAKSDVPALAALARPWPGGVT